MPLQLTGEWFHNVLKNLTPLIFQTGMYLPAYNFDTDTHRHFLKRITVPCLKTSRGHIQPQLATSDTNGQLAMLLS